MLPCGFYSQIIHILQVYVNNNFNIYVCTLYPIG